MTLTPAAFDPLTATIVAVTFNRSGLLSRLLTSISEMDPKPGRIVVIDNACAIASRATLPVLEVCCIINRS